MWSKSIMLVRVSSRDMGDCVRRARAVPSRRCSFLLPLWPLLQNHLFLADHAVSLGYVPQLLKQLSLRLPSASASGIPTTCPVWKPRHSSQLTSWCRIAREARSIPALRLFTCCDCDPRLIGVDMKSQPNQLGACLSLFQHDATAPCQT